MRQAGGDPTVDMGDEMVTGALGGLGSKFVGDLIKVGGKETSGNYIMPRESGKVLVDEVITPVAGAAVVGATTDDDK